jgi:hypothetical protein
MRGAPQVGFSATKRKIRVRTSLLTRLRPPICLALETHVQYKRNPARCQFTTVLGVTRTRGFVHPDQIVLNATQNSLCRTVNRRRGRFSWTESQVFEDEVFPKTTSADHPAQEMPEKHDHDKHFIGTVRIEPVAMSFILRVYEVLASHRGN